MKIILALISVILVESFGLASAQNGLVLSNKTGWQKIGEKTVDFSHNRDEIRVPGANRYSAIKLKATKSPINLITLKINYETGNDQEALLNHPLLPLGESRVIDLNGGERDVKKILLTYKKMPHSEDVKSHLELWGLKTDPVKPAATPVASIPPAPIVEPTNMHGWQKIGERTVDFQKGQNELWVLGDNRFGFVKFKVQGVSVTLLEVTLEYESGDYQMVSLASDIGVGMESRDIRLNGEERDLKRIVFVSNTIVNYRGEKATVEVWGKVTGADQSSQIRR